MGHLSSGVVRRTVLASAVIVSVAIVAVLLASNGPRAKKNQILTTAGPLANGVDQAALAQLTTTLAPTPPPTAPATSATTSAVAPTTTKPILRAAPAVAAPTTTAPLTTTTRPTKVADPTPPTVPTSPGGTTVTTGPITPVMVTINNSYSEAVTVNVGGQNHNVASGQLTAPFSVMPAATGNDIIEIRITANPGCGEGNAGGYFFSGNTYELSVLGGRGTCPGGGIAPIFQVTPSLVTTG